MPDHKVITDPELHEPKDVSTALAMQVYTADGASSGSWKFPMSPTIIVPETEADLGTDMGTFIQMAADTEYLINGTDANPLLFTKELRPGVNTVITGRAVTLSVMKYTGTGIAINYNNVAVNIEKIGLRCNNSTTATAIVIDNSGGTFLGVLREVRITDCNTPLDVTPGAGGILLTDFNFNTSTNGILLKGTSTGSFNISTGILAGITNDTIDLGTGVVDSFRIAGVQSVPASGKVALAGLVGGVNVTRTANVDGLNVNTILGGTGLSGISVEDLNWVFLDNTNIANSSWIGNFRKDSGRTTTTLITSTAVKIAGTTTLNAESTRFDDDTSTDNRLKALDSPTFKAMVNGSLIGQSSGGSSITCDLILRKNGTTDTVLVSGIIFPTGTDASFGFHAPLTVIQSDFFELFVTRTSGSQDLDAGSFDLTIVRVD